MKAKLNKDGLIKFTSFKTAKETINKMKRKLTNRKKMFENDTTNKRLISKHTNNIYSSIENKQTQPNHKIGRRPN